MKRTVLFLAMCCVLLTAGCGMNLKKTCFTASPIEPPVVKQEPTEASTSPPVEVFGSEDVKQFPYSLPEVKVYKPVATPKVLTKKSTKKIRKPVVAPVKYMVAEAPPTAPVVIPEQPALPGAKLEQAPITNTDTGMEIRGSPSTEKSWLSKWYHRYENFIVNNQILCLSIWIIVVLILRQFFFKKPRGT